MFSKIYKIAKKSTPKISKTEQTALDAGDNWFEKEIFQGKPDFEKLHSLKKFELSEEEKSFLENETVELCKMIDDWKINYEDKDLTVEAWDFIRKKGFLGLVISKEHGGKGFSAAAHSEVVMKLATKSVTAAISVMVPNSLGPGELLAHYGTDEQKKQYLPKLANGDEIPCFALTGPTAGSDATSLPDKGVVCYETFNGKKTLGIKLKNINKRYITLAPIATLVGLAFQLQDPDGLLGETGSEGITCALLPHNHKGLEIGKRGFPLAQAFMNGYIKAKDVFIPIDWIIGGQKMAGEGWRMLVECLSIGRAISLPACGTANTLMSAIMTSAYANVREQFKVPIAQFEGVQEKLAETAGLAYIANATRQFTVAAVDSGIRPSVSSAISKYHLTEMGRTTINNSMDIHGGRAIIMGPNNYLAIPYMATPIGITVEGANIMTRNLMIFGQGAMKCHPYIRNEIQSLMDSNEKEFSSNLKKHIGYMFSNGARTLWYGLSGGFTAPGYDSKFNRYYKSIYQMSTAYSYINDVSLTILGAGLKRKERLSSRLGDIMSYLYMASAVLKYYKDNGENSDDDIFVQWGVKYCLYNAQQSMISLFRNFPNRLLGIKMKFFVFPYGRKFRRPSDKLDAKICQELIANKGTRQWMKDICYVPNDDNDPIGRVENAFLAMLEAQNVKAKIDKAMKNGDLNKDYWCNLLDEALEKNIITTEDHKKAKSMSEKINNVIQTDEFDDYALGPKNAHPEWQKENSEK
ncbi:acyl-CoA dehydrogenase [Candidatus Francisella endociliophora]|uniref:Acyl-coenzyme A dehydrogenase n=1 Tax=Candidatus Francisella endociliophora TaxID=653937 RepID=A0A097EQZ2_9GAMM|nr:acyl-CoA dehydrogenase [Francisella sp. FSC1006]AIT09998.1 acyl-CoA dehydrogenase [Francisella sp. FSC1006]